MRYSQTDELAAAFIKIGLNPGDKIGMWGPNSTTWYLTMLAAARAGLVFVIHLNWIVLSIFRNFLVVLQVPINWTLQGPEIAYCMKLADIRAIVAPESHKTQHFYKILCDLIPDLATFKPGQLKNNNFNELTTIIIDSNSNFPYV